MMKKEGFVYIVTNETNTVLYTGVTRHLKQRIFQHKNKQVEGFTKKYNCTKLVWFMQGESIIAAIEEEKRIKAGSRKKKIALIESINPNYQDLAEDWF